MNEIETATKKLSICKIDVIFLLEKKKMEVNS